MVGRGFLKPDPAKLRPDTPKALRRLLETCLSYSRDNRSNFRNVSSVNYFVHRMKCWMTLTEKLTAHNEDWLLRGVSF